MFESLCFLPVEVAGSSAASDRKLKFGSRKSGEPSPSVLSAWPGADLLLLVVWAALSAQQEGQRAADLHFITGRRKQSSDWLEESRRGEVMCDVHATAEIRD